MMSLFIYIISIIITIFFVVGFHEFGHFIAARLVGVKVLRFSIGFGRTLFHWLDKKGTEYVIAPIPLGGYVKLLDESEEPVPKNELHLAYNRQPLYKRFIIVIAGPLANLIFAFFIYWVLFIVGFNSIVPLVGKITPNSIAATAGMQPEEEIISVNQEPTRNWTAVLIHMLTKAGDKGTMQIETKKNDANKNYSLDISNWQMNPLKPEPLQSLGILPYEPVIPNVIGQMKAGTPAANSLLKPGDKIISIENKPVTNWNELVQEIDKQPSKNISVTLIREGKTQTINVNVGFKRDAFFRKHGFLGIAPQFTMPANLLRQNKHDPITALSYAWHETDNFIRLNFIILGKMLTGKISLQSLGGPIAIFETAGTALNHGAVPFLAFLAFLSISIGIVNVLPIPGLDGGHILFQAIELVTRRPVSVRVQVMLYRFGMIFLMLLVIQTVVNDILRL